MASTGALFFAANGYFWRLPGAPWAAMTALGGSWWKSMETDILLDRTYMFHSPWLFLTIRMIRVSWDSFCLIGSRYQHNITSGNILLSDHCSLGHLFVGPPPTHRAGGTHEKCVSMQKCFHNDWSAAAFTSHTLLLPAESALHEV